MKDTIIISINSMEGGRLVCDTCKKGHLVIECTEMQWESLYHHHDGTFHTQDIAYGDHSTNETLTCDACDDGPSEEMVATIKRGMQNLTLAATPLDIKREEEKAMEFNSESKPFDQDKPLACWQCGGEVLFVEKNVMVDEILYEDGLLTLGRSNYHEPHGLGGHMICSKCGTSAGKEQRDYIVDRM